MDEIAYINKNSSKQTTKYVANDIKMGVNNQCGVLLFGVNAVGKSSLMKSIGVNIIMAQAGFFVSATEFTYYPYKYLFTRIKSNDNLHAGLSSFEVEMKEFKVILQFANHESIILGDELCSGTETQDATALVASGVGQLSQRNSSFLFATHLHFLAQMPYIKSLTNVTISCTENKIDEEYEEIVIGKGACVEFYLLENNWYIVSSDGLKLENL